MTITRSIAVVLAVVALVAVSCGDSDGTGEAPAPSTSAGATVTTTSAATGSEDTAVAKDGDAVAVNYVGTLDDGSEFDSSAGRAPLEFVVGSGQVIRGFDDAVRGLAVGESRTVRMEAADAYGAYDPDLVFVVPLDQAPDGLEAGMRVQVQGRVAVVTELTAETVTVDANHELAGQALTFQVELVSIG